SRSCLPVLRSASLATCPPSRRAAAGSPRTTTCPSVTTRPTPTVADPRPRPSSGRGCSDLSGPFEQVFGTSEQDVRVVQPLRRAHRFREILFFGVAPASMDLWPGLFFCAKRAATSLCGGEALCPPLMLYRAPAHSTGLCRPAY